MYNIIIHFEIVIFQEIMSNSREKTFIIFFRGYKTSIKRYMPYFPGFNLCHVSDCNDIQSDSKVLTHSVGLVEALIYFSKENIKPVHILVN